MTTHTTSKVRRVRGLVFGREYSIYNGGRPVHIETTRVDGKDICVFALGVDDSCVLTYLIDHGKLRLEGNKILNPPEEWVGLATWNTHAESAGASFYAVSLLSRLRGVKWENE